MTAIVAISIKQRKSGKPFILTASDSKRSHTDKPEGQLQSPIEERAKKIFKIHNKVIAMSGSFRPPFQNFLLENVKNEITKNSDIIEITSIIDRYSKMYIENEIENANLNIISCSIDNKVPKVSSYTIYKGAESGMIEYFHDEKGQIELVYGGMIPPDILKIKYSNMMIYGNLTPVEIRKVAESYLKDMSILFPDGCNDITQSLLIT